MTEVSVNNINGPMYDYDSVVAGLAPIFNSAFDGGGIEKNLYFSQNVPFRMANVQLITNPHYGDYNRWQWDNGNRQYIQGPGITLTHLDCGDIQPIFTVPGNSAILPRFMFEKYTPAAGEYPDVPAGKSIILLKVEQPGRASSDCAAAKSGYVVIPDNGDANLPMQARIEPTRSKCVGKRVRYGINWIVDPLGKIAIQMYYSSTELGALGAGKGPYLVSIIPGWDRYKRQPSNRDFALDGSNYCFFGIFRPSTPDAGATYFNTPPYSFTYNNRTFETKQPSWNWLGAFQLTYDVTTDGMEAYMNTYCMGTTTTCKNKTFPTCTKFMADGPIGATCTLASGLDPTGLAADRARMTVCGYDWKGKGAFSTPPRAQDLEALKTPDCSCINYEQSTFKQKALAGRNFADYTAWTVANNVPPIVATGYCWWPGCTDATLSLKAPSLTKPSSAVACPNVTQCITSIGAASIGGASSLTINAANVCGGGPAKKDDTVAPPIASGLPSAAALVGTTSDTPESGSITSQAWFWPVIAVVILLLLLAGYWFYRRSKKNAGLTETVPATENPVTATVNPVPATVNPIVATVNPIVATANPIVATANPVAATVNPVLK